MEGPGRREGTGEPWVTRTFSAIHPEQLPHPPTPGSPGGGREDGSESTVLSAAGGLAPPACYGLSRVPPWDG